MPLNDSDVAGHIFKPTGSAAGPAWGVSETWDGGRFPPRVYPLSLAGWFLANGCFPASFRVIGCQCEYAQTLENRAFKAVWGFELGPSIPPASIVTYCIIRT